MTFIRYRFAKNTTDFPSKYYCIHLEGRHCHRPPLVMSVTKTCVACSPTRSATFTRLYSRKRMRRYYAVLVSFRTCAINHRNFCFSAKEIENTLQAFCQLIPSFYASELWTPAVHRQSDYRESRIFYNCRPWYFNVAIRFEKSQNLINPLCVKSMWTNYVRCVLKIAVFLHHRFNTCQSMTANSVGGRI